MMNFTKKEIYFILQVNEEITTNIKILLSKRI